MALQAGRLGPGERASWACGGWEDVSLGAATWADDEWGCGLRDWGASGTASAPRVQGVRTPIASPAPKADCCIT